MSTWIYDWNVMFMRLFILWKTGFLQVRLENIPVIKYMNLLVSNLIQFGSMMVWVAQKDEREMPVLSVAVYYCSVAAGLGFRLCITLERYQWLLCVLKQGQSLCSDINASLSPVAGILWLSLQSGSSSDHPSVLHWFALWCGVFVLQLFRFWGPINMFYPSLFL